MSKESHGEHKRHVYLEDVPLDQAQAKFLSALEEAGGLSVTEAETVPLEEALHRVTAEAVWAALSSPHYHAAAMDGAAVRAEDTDNASEKTPVKLRLGEQAQWVDTGMPLPQEFDAVVMVENIQSLDESTIEIMQPVAPWQHVRVMGEDIVTTELLLPSGHRLSPVDLGSMAQAGLSQVVVKKQPRVAIIPTGTELVSPGGPLRPGNIIESNSLVLAGLAEEYGATATRSRPVPDDYESLKDAIRRALADSDIVVLNAGASAGRKDFTANLISDMGRLVVHGVAIRPGHPVVLGIVDDKPVVGLPGYPVSAALTFDLFVRPLIYRLQGLATPRRDTVRATMTRKIFSPMGQEEFLRVKVGRVSGRYLAMPLQRGAGTTMSLVRADGLVRIPSESEGVHERQEVTVDLLSSLEQIDNAIIAIGSHDLALDVLSHHLHQRYPAITLSSTNVGSLGGLMALSRGEAHLAGSHLLDEETGEYNVPYVRRLLGDAHMVVVNLVFREQGLMVAKGNPKAIESLADLTRPDVSLINRQRGAGTRVLLDYNMKKMGLDTARIKGYNRVAFTHLAVAAAVFGGSADTGLGIVAAAKALDLDFVPLMKERYDLVIPRSHFDNPLLAPLLEMLGEPCFKSEVEGLGGYDVSQMGRVVAEV